MDFSTACCGSFADNGPVTLNHVQFDATFNGVLLTAGTDQQLNVNNSVFTSFNPVNGGSGSALVSLGGTTITDLNYNNNYVFGPTGILVNIGGVATSSIIKGNQIRSTASGLGNCIYIASGTQAQIEGNVCKGGFSAAVSASGVSTLYAPSGANAL